tara:strand:+ start:108 stop:797 length:690 start_codon:yes stop_codon:yes gene_type:complete
MAFKLRSGNKLSFKSMGSSPAKQYAKKTGPRANPKGSWKFEKGEEPKYEGRSWTEKEIKESNEAIKVRNKKIDIDKTVDKALNVKGKKYPPHMHKSKILKKSPAKQKMKNKFPPKQLEILPFEGIKPDYPTFKEKNPRLHERRLPSMRPINPVTPKMQSIKQPMERIKSKPIEVERKKAPKIKPTPQPTRPSKRIEKPIQTRASRGGGRLVEKKSPAKMCGCGKKKCSC